MVVGVGVERAHATGTLRGAVGDALKARLARREHLARHAAALARHTRRRRRAPAAPAQDPLGAALRGREALRRAVLRARQRLTLAGRDRLGIDTAPKAHARATHTASALEPAGTAALAQPLRRALGIARDRRPPSLAAPPQFVGPDAVVRKIAGTTGALPHLLHLAARGEPEHEEESSEPHARIERWFGPS